MKRQKPAVLRRLSDPDFQGRVVERSLWVNITLSALLCVFVIHDVYIWVNPPRPKFFYVDGQNPPRPAVPLESPILGQDQLLS